MCKDKTPIKSLGLDQETEQRLALWMGNAHTIGQLRGHGEQVFVNAGFTHKQATDITTAVSAAYS
jgi:hypothetical protein